MRSTNEISSRIRQFIINHFPRAQQRSIIDDDSLLGSGIVDSLGVLDLVAFVEGEFGITIDAEELLPENFQSIASLTLFTKTKLDDAQGFQ
jgi:acyl carrier protein